MSFSSRNLTVRTPVDLVTAVPYLIGFHPSDNSVAVVACNHGQVVFAARGDLPEPDANPTHTVADMLIPVIRQQHHITDLILIGYGDARHIDPALHQIAEAFTAAGVPIGPLLRLTSGRVYNLTCTDPACCPPHGTPVDPTTSLFAVQATAAGLVALPDRAAVAARFAPTKTADRDSMRLAAAEALTRLDALHTSGKAAIRKAGTQAVRHSLRQHDAGQRLTDSEIAWLTLLLTQTAVRDLAAQHTQPDDQHVTFWAEITRRADEPLIPAPATLLALTAWRYGDGTLATMAAERALQANPAYQLAALLLHAVQAGLPPSTYERAAGGGL